MQKNAAKILIWSFVIFGLSRAEAYSFMPTDTDWASWPDHCKAKYVWTPYGRSTKFAGDVGAAETAALEPWEEAGIRGLHHYCTGMIWLKRAKLERDSVQRKYMLRNALNETQFTFERSPWSTPLFAPIGIQMATIMYEQGELEEALNLLQSMIKAQPNTAVVYSATAVIQRQLGELEESKKTLVAGYNAVGGRSAEINYNLGLVSIELGELDQAVKYAEAAYELGFPLQGLRTKLEKLGRM